MCLRRLLPFVLFLLTATPVPAQEAARTEGPVAGEEATSYIVFLDDFFSVPSERNRVLRGLRNQLSLLGPEDRMTIFAFDGKQLDRLVDWTSSQWRLAEVLKQAEKRPSYGLMRLSEQRRLQVSPSERGGFGAPPSSFSRRGFTGSLRDEPIRFQPGPDLLENIAVVVDAVQDALHEADHETEAPDPPSSNSAEPADDAPGRSALILLAGGWPLPIADSTSPSRSVAEVETRDALLGPLLETAEKLRVVVYPVDLRGAGRESFAERERGAALDRFARDTGGRLVERGDRREALEFIRSHQSRSDLSQGDTP